MEAGRGVGVPPGYTYGMPVLPQSSPRRLIMANAHTARIRRSGSNGSSFGRPHDYGSSSSAGRGRRIGGGGSSAVGDGFNALANRSYNSSSSNSSSGNVRRSSSGRLIGDFSGDDDGGGDRGGKRSTEIIFKSAAARAKNHALFLAQLRRRPVIMSPRRRQEKGRAVGSGAGIGVDSAAGISRSSSTVYEAVSIRSLNDLRSKARKTLEQNASDIERRNPQGAEQLRKDARHIENWGREAEKGAKREAAENARRLSRDLDQREAEQASARKKVAEAAAAAEAAEGLAREKEETARIRAEEEEAARRRAEAEEEETRLAAAAAAAATAAATAVQKRPALTAEQEQQVREAWSSTMGGADNDEVVVRAFNDMVSRGSMRTLRDGEWLGDEVINLYMKSIQARNRESVENGEQVPKCGIMSSFFFTQLSDNGRGYRYQGVKRFLKKAKIDLFDLDKFLFPVNVNQNHWTLAVINFRLERLEYYDSLGSPLGDQRFEYMARFVDDESKSKRGGLEMDISGWPRFNYADVPHQRNTIDCGVFACMFADRLSKGRPLSFSQSDIAHYRRVMTLVILRGERSPTQEEAFLEDGGSVPGDAPGWWEPPQEGGNGFDAEEIEEEEEEEEGKEWWVTERQGVEEEEEEENEREHLFDLTSDGGPGEDEEEEEEARHANGGYDLASDVEQVGGIDLASEGEEIQEGAGGDFVDGAVERGWEHDHAATGERSSGGLDTPFASSSPFPPQQQQWQGGWGRPPHLQQVTEGWNFRPSLGGSWPEERRDVTATPGGATAAAATAATTSSPEREFDAAAASDENGFGLIVRGTTDHHLMRGRGMKRHNFIGGATKLGMREVFGQHSVGAAALPARQGVGEEEEGGADYAVRAAAEDDPS